MPMPCPHICRADPQPRVPPRARLTPLGFHLHIPADAVLIPAGSHPHNAADAGLIAMGSHPCIPPGSHPHTVLIPAGPVLTSLAEVRLIAMGSRPHIPQWLLCCRTPTPNPYGCQPAPCRTPTPHIPHGSPFPLPHPNATRRPTGSPGRTRSSGCGAACGASSPSMCTMQTHWAPHCTPRPMLCSPPSAWRPSAPTAQPLGER